MGGSKISNLTPFSIIAWVVSVVFHPIVYATLGTAVLLLLLPEYHYFHIEVKQRLLSIIFIVTYVLPLVIIPLYYLLLRVSKTKVGERHARLFLLFATTLIYSFVYKNLLVYSFFSSIHVYLLLCTSLLFVSFIITFFWKISLHMIGVGGFVGLLFSLLIFNHIYNEILFAAAVFVAGTVAFARVLLQAHTQLQIYIGFAVGFIISVLFLSLLPL